MLLEELFSVKTQFFNYLTKQRTGNMFRYLNFIKIIRYFNVFISLKLSVVTAHVFHLVRVCVCLRMSAQQIGVLHFKKFSRQYIFAFFQPSQNSQKFLICENFLFYNQCTRIMFTGYNVNHILLYIMIRTLPIIYTLDMTQINISLFPWKYKPHRKNNWGRIKETMLVAAVCMSCLSKQI